MKYEIGKSIDKTVEIDRWLIERYALFQYTEKAINEFDIHHIEWPLNEIELTDIKVDYPRFKKLLNNTPDRKQYSKGVQVIAWGEKTYKKQKS